MPRRLSAQTSQIPVVLVAGGAGFLGSHICESLLQSGVKVIAVDDLVTGNAANLAAIKNHPNFEFIEYNLNTGVPAGLEDKPISYIVHAAGVETHGESQQASLALALTGAFGTKNLLDLAVSTGARFLLVSSVSVYDGLISSTNLTYYYGSQPEQEAKFSQYEAKRYAEGLCELYAKEYNLDVRVARVSQMYGPRMDLRSPELIARLIKMAVAGQDLKVDANGNTVLLLTYVADAVYGISKLLFADGPQFKGAIYPFYNPEKVSAISVAYTLRDFLPQEGEITFVPPKEMDPQPLPTVSLDRVKRDLDWEPSVSITQGLKLTMEAFKAQPPDLTDHTVTEQQLATLAAVLPLAPVTASSASSAPAADVKAVENSPQVAEATVPSTPSQPTTKKPAKKPAKKGWWRRWILAAVLLGLYFSVGRPMVHTLAYGAAGGWAAQSGVRQAKTLAFGSASGSFASAATNLQRASQSIEGLAWLASISGQQQTYYQTHQLLLGAAASAKGAATLSQAAEPLVGQAKQLLTLTPSAQKGTFISILQHSQTLVTEAQSQLQAADVAYNKPQSSQVAGVSWSDGQEDSRGLMGSYLQRVEAVNAQVLSATNQLSQALSVAPELLGQSETQRYLVLLENSNELRPTGGFLGSYMLVTVQNGRIMSLKIDDIYNPANQLERQTTAPAPLSQALGQQTLGLVDANWSPDGPTAAQQVAALYTEATDIPINGVVFITSQTVKQILAASGPLKLPDYAETVTADNVMQLAQIYSDVGFTPGSTAKKDFLTAMTDQLLLRWQSGGTNQLLPLAKAMLASAEQGEVIAWSDKASAQKLVMDMGWAGQIKTTSGDYLRVVDANLGGNKANYYVQRSTVYAINVDRDKALHAVTTVVWKHSGTSATWPGGDYTNYVRIYAPLGSVLESSDGFKDNQVVVGQENGKTVFGGFVTVPYQTTRSITVRYGLPASLSLPLTNGRYQLTWQKQTGIAEEPFRATFNTPIFLQATGVLAAGKVGEDGSVIWQSKQTKDSSLGLQLESRTNL